MSRTICRERRHQDAAEARVLDATPEHSSPCAREDRRTRRRRAERRGASAQGARSPLPPAATPSRGRPRSARASRCSTVGSATSCWLSGCGCGREAADAAREPDRSCAGCRSEMPEAAVLPDRQRQQRRREPEQRTASSVRQRVDSSRARGAKRKIEFDGLIGDRSTRLRARGHGHRPAAAALQRAQAEVGRDEQRHHRSGSRARTVSPTTCGSVSSVYFWW